MSLRVNNNKRKRLVRAAAEEGIVSRKRRTRAARLMDVEDVDDGEETFGQMIRRQLLNCTSVSSDSDNSTLDSPMESYTSEPTHFLDSTQPSTSHISRHSDPGRVSDDSFEEAPIAIQEGILASQANVGDNVNDSLTDVMQFVESVTAAESSSMTRAIEDRYKRLLETQRQIEEEIRRNQPQNHIDIIEEAEVVDVLHMEPPTLPLPDTIDLHDVSRAGGVQIGDCPICMEPPQANNLSSTFCGHIFCTPCIVQAVESSKQCPICRTKLRITKIHPLHI